MNPLRVSILLFALAGIVSAANINGNIAFRMSDPHNLLLEYPRLIINGGQFEALTLSNGSFSFYNVPAGKYFMEVVHNTFTYPTYTIDCQSDGSWTALEYTHPGAHMNPVDTPLSINPIAPSHYFEDRPRMSMMGMLANPMVLMMLLMLCMGYMTKNMDPEQMREMQEQQRNMGFDPSDPMASFRSLLSGDNPSPASSRPAPRQRAA